MIEYRRRALELFAEKNDLSEKQKKQLDKVLESLDLAVTSCFIVDREVLIETKDAVIDLSGNVSMFYTSRPNQSLIERTAYRDKLRERRVARWTDWERRQKYNEHCTSEELKQRALAARKEAKEVKIQHEIKKRLINGGRA
ncbi:MAG: hypothetical protein ACRC76_10020 [Proteocatella sp.]